MKDKDYHAHSLDAHLDNLYTILRDGYSDAIFDPIGEEAAMLSQLFSFLEEHINAGGCCGAGGNPPHDTGGRTPANQAPDTKTRTARLSDNAKSTEAR